MALPFIMPVERFHLRVGVGLTVVSFKHYRE